jgi:hypothetical protein
MKHAIVGSLTALLAGAGLALAQPPAESLPTPRTYSAGSGREVAPDQATPILTYGPGPSGAPGPGPGEPPGPSLIPAVAIDGIPYRFWIEGDYHGWWVKENRFPSLLVSVNSSGQQSLLAGSDTLDSSFRNGGGMTLGGWITDYHGFGLEGSWFVMEGRSKEFSITGTGAANAAAIGRPFFNVLTGAEELFLVSQPPFTSFSFQTQPIDIIRTTTTTSGTAAATTEGIQCDNGRFFGADLHFIGNICCDATCRLDFLIGYRFLELDDRFAMEQDTLSSATSTSLRFGTQTNTSTVSSISDRVNTGNHFNGGQIGLRGEWHGDRWFIKGTAAVSFGATDEGADLFGQTTFISTTAAPITVPGGFLVTPSRIGSFSTEQFAVVPEAHLTIGYAVCDWFKLTFGYTFLYWSSVVRAGDQISHAVNPAEVPAIAGINNSGAIVQPLTQLKCNDFWAHGFNAGIELRF